MGSGGAEERRSGGAEERRSGGAEERRSGGAGELGKKRELIIFGYNDPEAPKEIWTDYVWAGNEAEAMQKCQVKAQTATMG
ncbi:MAG: hypothetical protein F6K41_22980 [Symploca sp. SIO3E6]|nr:hypothetical protein [Caldora sp. SIO3E6]